MLIPDLARDYIGRAAVRLGALDVLHEAESWADVVWESQEVVELALKALLRDHGIDPPRVHDVSDALVTASRQLRRDRELAFYGAEDLIPSGFYSEDDAVRARASARRVVAVVQPHVAGGAA